MTFGFGFGFPRKISCALGGSGSGPTLDLDFLLGTLPSTITFTRSSTATFFNSAGVVTSAAIDGPRFDYNPTTLALSGLLIEEQRTNSIRNSTAVGAVAGTPGTLPTNWVSALAGLTQTIVGTGVENGIAYVDIRLNGTATGTSAGIRFETNTGIAVASGQTWTASTFCRLVGGSTTNVTSCSLGVSGLTAGAAATADSQSSSLLGVLSMTNISTTRTARAITFADATTAFARVQIIVGFTSGAAIDITLRIGLPQLERGGFATSVIPTSGATATRAPDIAVMTGTNFSSWYNPSTGTFVATYEASPNAFTTYLVASNGVTAQNSFHFDNDSGSMRAVYYSGSAAVALLSLGAVGTAGTVNKVASAYAVNDFAASRNAGAVVTDTAGAVPVSLTQLNIGADPSGAAANVMNTHIRRITYYPRRLGNAELQVVTT